MKQLLLILGFLLALCVGLDVRAQTPVFAKGADVGWLTEMEAAGYKFYNNAGAQQDLLQILRNKDMNTIRLRVWVNPTGGWNGKADVVAKAVRAQNLGFRLLIDFHYSDSWADPGKQTKPAAWQGYSLAQLKTAVYDHTYDVLSALKENNVVPEWVQVGNETNDGMLWPEGRASTNMANFAQLVDQGYAAVKAVHPTSKVIVHVSNGFDNGLFRYLFDGLRANGARWDVIGMSLYPSPANWPTLTAQSLTNMNDMVTRYPGKEVMMVETGMPANAPVPTQQMLLDLIAKVKSVPANKGLGVLYWEPQAYNWQGYGLGAWDNNGQPTAALDAFLDTPPAQGLVYNAGFEYTSATQQPLGWATTSTADANADFTQSGGHTGLYQLTHSKGVAYQVRTSQVVTNLPNGSYTFRAWVKSSGGQAVCQLYAAEFGGSERAMSIPAAAEWVQVQIPNILVTNGQCEIGLRSTASAGNTCNLDDVELLPAQVTATSKNAPQGTNLAVQVFPNPTSGKLTLAYSLPQSQTVQVSLYTLTGQHLLVLSAPHLVGKGNHQMEISNTIDLVPGVYLLKITHGSYVITRKLIKL